MAELFDNNPLLDAQEAVLVHMTLLTGTYSLTDKMLQAFWTGTSVLVVCLKAILPVGVPFLTLNA